MNQNELESKIERANLFDFFIFLAAKKKRILVNFVITCILSIIFALLLPLKFKSTFSFIPPSGATGFAASLLGDMSFGNIADANNPTPPQVSFLLNSSSVQEKLVHQFNLIHRYKTHKAKNPVELAIKQLKKNILIEETAVGGLGYEEIIGFKISIVDRNPDTAFLMAQTFHKEIESKFIEVFSRKSSFDMDFYGKVLAENKERLKAAQDSFLVFQRKTGIYAPTEQAEASLKLYSSLSAEIALRKVQLNIQARNYGSNSAGVQKLQEEINALSQELKNINSRSSNDFYIRLSEIPEQALEFFNRKRDLEILEKTYLLLYQQFKQAEFQSKKNIPILKIVDYPQRPEYKFKPKRSIVILTMVAVEMILFLSVFIVAYFWEKQVFNNKKIKSLINAWLTQH